MERKREDFRGKRPSWVKKACFPIVGLLFTVGGASCVSLQKPPASPSPPPVSPSLPGSPLLTLAPKPILSQRIHFLENYLTQKGISRKNRQAAEKVLETYRSLLNVLSGSLTLENRERLIQSLFGSLLKIEEMYFEQHLQKIDIIPEDGDIYIGEFQLPPQKKNDREHAKTPKQNTSSIEISLKTEKMQKGPLPQETLKDTEMPRGEMTPDLNVLLQKINALVEKRKFEEASRLLLKTEIETKPSLTKEIIIRAKECVNAESKAKAMPEKIEHRNVEKIGKQAKDLIEQEKYEEAISRLGTVESPPSDKEEEKLARLKENAVNNLINRERNRAANFFLKAKKTKDPAEKQEALCISRDILTDLVLSYPNSIQVNKVKQNLKVVEQALEQLQ